MENSKLLGQLIAIILIIGGLLIIIAFFKNPFSIILNKIRDTHPLVEKIRLNTAKFIEHNYVLGENLSLTNLEQEINFEIRRLFETRGSTLQSLIIIQIVARHELRSKNSSQISSIIERIKSSAIQKGIKYHDIDIEFTYGSLLPHGREVFEKEAEEIAQKILDLLDMRPSIIGDLYDIRNNKYLET